MLQPRRPTIADGWKAEHSPGPLSQIRTRADPAREEGMHKSPCMFYRCANVAGGTSFGYWDSSLMHAPRSTDVTSISSTCGARRRPSRARSLAPGRIGPETGQGPRGPRAAATERMGLCRRRKAPPAVRPNRTYFLRFSYVSRPPFRKNRFFVRAPIIASGSTLHQSRSPAVRPWGAGGPPRRRA